MVGVCFLGRICRKVPDLRKDTAIVEQRGWSLVSGESLRRKDQTLREDTAIVERRGLSLGSGQNL